MLGRVRRLFRALTALGAAMALGLSPPLAAQSEPDAPSDAEIAVKAFQAKEARLFAIGYRLATSNAPFCKDALPSIGLLLHDAASYGDPAEVRSSLGLLGDIGVQAVAAGSPAEAVGIAPNDTIDRIAGLTPYAMLVDSKESWRRLMAINDAIEAELKSAGKVQIDWRTPSGELRSATLEGAASCPSRFELASSGKQAIADGSRVILGPDFPGFGYPEPLLAAAISHEMAHILLGHREWLGAAGRTRSNIRTSETEADRLMPWLLANAGYDPRAAIEFMELWGPSHGGGLFRKRTHEGWDERVEFIDIEYGIIEQLWDDEGQADWARYFERSTGTPVD